MRYFFSIRFLLRYGVLTLMLRGEYTRREVISYIVLTRWNKFNKPIEERITRASRVIHGTTNSSSGRSLKFVAFLDTSRPVWRTPDARPVYAHGLMHLLSRENRLIRENWSSVKDLVPRSIRMPWALIFSTSWSIRSVGPPLSLLFFFLFLSLPSSLSLFFLTVKGVFDRINLDLFQTGSRYNLLTRLNLS